MSWLGSRGAKNLDTDPSVAYLKLPISEASAPEWKTDWMVHYCRTQSDKGNLFLINTDLRFSKFLPTNLEHPTKLTTYMDLSPDQRLYYRQWLQSGRKFVPAEAYLLLYLCSIERRIFEDGANLPELRCELKRLLLLCFREPRCAQFTEFPYYSTVLLWFLYAKFPEPISALVVLIFCECLEGRVSNHKERERILEQLKKQNFERSVLFPVSRNQLKYEPVNEFLPSIRTVEAPSLEEMRPVLSRIWEQARKVVMPPLRPRITEPTKPAPISNQNSIPQKIENRKQRRKNQLPNLKSSRSVAPIGNLGVAILAKQKEMNADLQSVVEQASQNFKR